MTQTIKNSQIAGDAISGNKHVTVIEAKKTPLEQLQLRLQQEIQDESQVGLILDELSHYKSRKKDYRDIEQKLTEAGYSDLIDEAQELKELVTMLILKYENYQSAQKILVYLLAGIESIFEARIKPKILTNEDGYKIKEAIHDYVEVAYMDMLGENTLNIFNRQLKGMVFYLTGNCHVEWV